MKKDTGARRPSPAIRDRGGALSRTLGTYGGYTVVVEDGMLQALWKITVAGYAFHGNHSFEIYACRGGERMTLREAYERGALSAEDIAAVHDAFGGVRVGVKYDVK